MSQEWFPLIATGVTALYAMGVLFKIVWDKHVFDEHERQQRELGRIKRRRRES